MIRYRLEMSRAVRDLITHLPPELKRKIRTAFRARAENPHQAKALKDELAGLRSHRLGSTRIILRVTGHVVEVIALGSRRDIYERVATELSALLRKKKKGEKTIS